MARKIYRLLISCCVEGINTHCRGKARHPFVPAATPATALCTSEYCCLPHKIFQDRSEMAEDQEGRQNPLFPKTNYIFPFLLLLFSLSFSFFCSFVVVCVLGIDPWAWCTLSSCCIRSCISSPDKFLYPCVSWFIYKFYIPSLELEFVNSCDGKRSQNKHYWQYLGRKWEVCVTVCHTERLRMERICPLGEINKTVGNETQWGWGDQGSHPTHSGLCFLHCLPPRCHNCLINKSRL